MVAVPRAGPKTPSRDQGKVISIRLAILDDYQNVVLTLADWSKVKRHMDVRVYDRAFASEQETAAELADCEVVAIMRERTPFPRSLFERLPKLRLFVTTGLRNLSIDIEAARERGVAVCGTEILKYPTAELTWGLVLAVARHIPFEHEAMRADRWQTTLGTGLNGKTLGVVGLGAQGGQVAKYGQAFGMDVIAWSPNLTPERCAPLGVRCVSKEALFAEADVVSVHMVLSATTRGLVGGAEIGWMKKSAILVNTARGPLVDEAALIAALRARRIAGAGIDVYDREPLPADHPMRRLDNVVLTPHLGYVTRETYAIFFPQVVEDIEAWVDGRLVRSLVKPS